MEGNIGFEFPEVKKLPLWGKGFVKWFCGLVKWFWLFSWIIGLGWNSPGCFELGSLYIEKKKLIKNHIQQIKKSLIFYKKVNYK